MANRCRNYATVVYPESAPDNWKSILEEHFVGAFISPLHNSDVNPDGEPKKPHYHVMIMFDGVKTKEQASEVLFSIGGVGCEIVKSIRAYARYLCHLDNPDKVQYSPDDVVCLGGSDYYGTIGLAIDKYKAISEMIEFIEDNNITSLNYLINYARYERFDWFRILCDSCYLVKEVLKCKREDILYNESK